MFLLDDPARFREKLSDPFLLYWMTHVYQFGPAVMRQRLTGLLDAPTIATIATGPHTVAASDLIHILPDETFSRSSDWVAAHWHELDEDVAKEALGKLTDVAPDLAERLAIEHVARLGDRFPQDIRDGECIRAIGQGRSEQGCIVGQQLVDRFLAGSSSGLKYALLGLCLSRDLPCGPAVVMRELVRAREKRKLTACLHRLVDQMSGPLAFQFVVEDAIVLANPRPLDDLRPLLDPRADLTGLGRVLRHQTSTPVADLIAWSRDVFGADDSSTAVRLLKEAGGAHGLDLELVTLAATMFLARLALKNPPTGDLSLEGIIRVVAHSVGLGDLAPAFADRLHAFPAEQVLAELRRFLGPGDEADPMARFNALKILRELAFPAAFEILVEQLGREADDPAVDYGVDALVALGGVGGDRLVGRFRDLPPDVQVQACRVVARTGGPAALSLAEEWLPGSTGALRAELCDVIMFWPDPSHVAVLEPAAPGEDLAADEALVVMELLHGIDSPRSAARREVLLKKDDSNLPVLCPHCGHEGLPSGDVHPDHDDYEFDEEDGEESDVGEDASPAPPAIPARTVEKVGRNDPCPCGSGKKFKKCCLGRADS